LNKPIRDENLKESFSIAGFYIFEQIDTDFLCSPEIEDILKLIFDLPILSKWRTLKKEGQTADRATTDHVGCLVLCFKFYLEYQARFFSALPTITL